MSSYDSITKKVQFYCREAVRLFVEVALKNSSICNDSEARECNYMMIFSMFPDFCIIHTCHTFKLSIVNHSLSRFSSFPNFQANKVLQEKILPLMLNKKKTLVKYSDCQVIFMVKNNFFAV